MQAKFLRETLDLGEAAGGTYPAEGGMEAPEVWARLYILDKQFKAAEGIYLEQGNLEAALEMYQAMPNNRNDQYWAGLSG